MSHYLGFDIGGSHMSVGLVKCSGEERTVLQLSSRPVDSTCSVNELIDGLVDFIHTFLGSTGINQVSGIGFSIPGPFNYQSGVSEMRNNNKYDNLFGVDLRTTLINRLPNEWGLKGEDLHFINDAQGFLLGCVRENGWENEHVLGLTLGTGLGAAHYADRSLMLNGSKGYAGYLYDTPYREGIAEDYFSTRWFADRYAHLKGEGQQGIENVKQLAGQADNPVAMQVFREFGMNLADFLNVTVPLREYDRVVVGGSIAKSHVFFNDALTEGLTTGTVSYINNTPSSAIIGAVDHVVKQHENKKEFPRTSPNPMLPVDKQNAPDPDGYDIYPTFQLDQRKISCGFSGLARWIAEQEAVVIDGYSGVLWDQFVDRLNRHIKAQGVQADWYCIDAALKEEEELKKLKAPYLGGGDPVFGRRFEGELKEFFDEEKLADLKVASTGVSILYGSGAALADIEAPVVYVEVPKNEIQYRSRSGSIAALGGFQVADPKEQYKHFYFVDWPVLNRHKKDLLEDMVVIVDEQRIDEITWMSGREFRRGLDLMVKNTIRARPWFEPGVWGGDWMLENIQGLSEDVPNYAWSFELIVPENGLIMESSGLMLEVSFDYLQYHDNQSVLGNASGLFGHEFPIRFDFLDTFNGQNLSLQCHPSETYIYEHFGERFTQDETYYILDCEDNAEVYLGFQEGVDKDQFRKDLEQSYEQKIPVDVEKYVQTHSASKHDLFLIPSQTIHCSGTNNMVLEISNTPYIYTFKVYDWLRVDLEGNPRPINIERAFENLDFTRRGESVEEEFISTPRVFEEGKDWQKVNLPTHPNHFYSVHRLHFETSMEVQTRDQCHILSLVEGEAITVETNNRSQRVHYAETFVVPSAAESYRLINHGSKPAKVVKAFVKDEEQIRVKPYRSGSE